MEIQQATEQRAVKMVMVRLTPMIYDQCRSLAKRTKLPMAVLCRQIIEGALAEGIDVVPAGAPAQPNGK